MVDPDDIRAFGFFGKGLFVNFSALEGILSLFQDCNATETDGG